LLGRVEEEVAKLAAHLPETIRVKEAELGAEERRLGSTPSKFRPTPPRSPHLNGKVERSQHTDWVEFYATADLADPDLPLRLEEWQFFYNWRRPHWRSSRSTVGIDLR